MSDHGSNIVQAEFFHAVGNSIDEVMEDCARRIVEDSKIKTVVRFYDQGNRITRHIQEMKNLDAEFTELHLGFQGAGWFQRSRMRGRIRSLSKQSALLNDVLAPLLVERLAEVIHAKGELAVECSDYSFRKVFPEELHELYESAKASPRAWAFIFGPGSLVAHNKRLIVSAM